MLSERASKQKELTWNICEIENHFINELQKSRSNLAEKYRFGKLEDKYLTTIDEIYRKQNLNYLKGK